MEAIPVASSSPVRNGGHRLSQCTSFAMCHDGMRVDTRTNDAYGTGTATGTGTGAGVGFRQRLLVFQMRYVIAPIGIWIA